MNIFKKWLKQKLRKFLEIDKMEETFYVLAKNEQDAERIFRLRYNIDIFGEDIIESIDEFVETYFHTEGEILNTISR